MATDKRKGRAPRVNDPEGVRRNILEVATAEFAQRGFSGARVDAIANRTRTSKRMIYYYFGSKERLYLAVLEAAYSAIRQEEATLDLDQAPEQALAALVASTFDYYHAHPEFVRLVMAENIMDGVHMKRSKAIGTLNVTVIDALKRILARGQKAGRFRRGIDPVELHMTISALGIFNVANRATFSTIFKRDMSSPRALAERRDEIVEMILQHVRS